MAIFCLTEENPDVFTEFLGLVLGAFLF